MVGSKIDISGNADNFAVNGPLTEPSLTSEIESQKKTEEITEKVIIPQKSGFIINEEITEKVPQKMNYAEALKKSARLFSTGKVNILEFAAQIKNSKNIK